MHAGTYDNGHAFEREILGCCTGVDCRKAPVYYPYKKALGFACTHQPVRKSEEIQFLEREISRILGTPTKFFSAVGTSLDVHHGTDGLFVSHGGATIVTIDLTRNPLKDCGKADMIIHEGDLDNLSALAGQIARELKSKLH